MRHIKYILILLLLGLLPSAVLVEKPDFRHRGFYLHEGWFFNYPFAVRTWSREDFAKMFRLLRLMGYDQVGIWPMLEAIPMPLNEADKQSLREFRHTIDDAHAAQLECWLVQCPNLTPDPSIAAKPWSQRNPYHAWRQVRLDDRAQAKPYLAHRTAMISILNNADAYVTIDGDPGGYPEAKPEEWLNVFLSDRLAIDHYGVNPSQQRLIPWVWCGWGTTQVWGGNPTNPPSLIRPYTSATMELFKTAMPQPWSLLAGRSHRDGWANGRINVKLADSLKLMNRTTIFCYEAIEFEPAPPASVLQFDQIRRILREESGYAAVAAGVFGNAQQPVMVLPNLYFFARGSYDLKYLDKPDEEILKDFAHFMGGPPEVLVPAWDCMNRSLETLPTNLPQLLRTIKFNSGPALLIPGGPGQYLEILAKQTESHIRLLRATAKPAASDEQAAIKIAEGIATLVSWWNVHRYVKDGNAGGPFDLSFVHSSEVSILRKWSLLHVKNQMFVSKLAALVLSNNKTLTKPEATKVLRELFSENAQSH